MCKMAQYIPRSIIFPDRKENQQDRNLNPNHELELLPVSTTQILRVAASVNRTTSTLTSTTTLCYTEHKHFLCHNIHSILLASQSESRPVFLVQAQDQITSDIHYSHFRRGSNHTLLFPCPLTSLYARNKKHGAT